jgi:hypothetical protein
MACTRLNRVASGTDRRSPAFRPPSEANTPSRRPSTALDDGAGPDDVFRLEPVATGRDGAPEGDLQRRSHAPQAEICEEVDRAFVERERGRHRVPFCAGGLQDTG